MSTVDDKTDSPVTEPVINLPVNKVTIVEPPINVNKVGTSKSINPQMDNLIKMAERANAKLTEPPAKPVIEIKVIQTNTDKVLIILKNHGMDSQQAERALVGLMKLTTPES